jgi:F0F1-type ATP synthase assembly protein I
MSIGFKNRVETAKLTFRREVKSIRDGIAFLHQCLSQRPPRKIQVSWKEKLFHREKARAVRDANRRNLDNFYSWQQDLRAKTHSIWFCAILGTVALMCIGAGTQDLAMCFFAIPWFTVWMVRLSRLAERNPRPLLVVEPDVHSRATNIRRVGAGVGFVSGALAGATVGAGAGIVAGPLGAIAGTIPGALIGGILGLLGGEEVGYHLQSPQSPGVQNPDQNHEKAKVGAAAGLAAGAVAGATIGSGVGIAAGPIGAIAGTVPGALIGGLIGMLSGAKLGR